MEKKKKKVCFTIILSHDKDGTNYYTNSYHRKKRSVSRKYCLRRMLNDTTFKRKLLANKKKK